MHRRSNLSPPRIAALRAGITMSVISISITLCAAWLPGHAFAQASEPEPVPALRIAGRVLIDLTAVVRRYGWSASDAHATLTVRTDAGVLTVFDGAPDVLWQRAGDQGPSTIALSTPPKRTTTGWFVPEDLLQVLGIERTAGAVAVPGGRAALRFPPPARLGEGFELAQLGGGTVGLRFYGAGSAGPDTVSMLVSDLTLLALALPEHRALLDDVLVDDPLATAQPLLVAVTALAQASWEAALVFEQGDLRFEARHPFRFQIAAGAADRVGPDAPVLAVVLLPQSFSLEAPLLVTWGEVSAEVTFRPGR